jgi:hypothetical protein
MYRLLILTALVFFLSIEAFSSCHELPIEQDDIKIGPVGTLRAR